MSDDDDNIMCERCGKEKATVHLTDFADGNPVQRHLCDECYGKEEELPLLSPGNLLSQLVASIAPELQQLAALKCPECGMTYLQFRQTLSLGCPNDYEAFSEPLDQLLENVHGAKRHTGRVPQGAAQQAGSGPALAVLQRRLDEAVKDEDFERAARLRDEIKTLEQKSAERTDQ